jgi:hypothetical protein
MTVMNVDKKELLISHLFDASGEVVFGAWTNPEQLKHWYAPDDVQLNLQLLIPPKEAIFILASMIRCMENVGLKAPTWK